ncbi:hypothetical protein HCN44_010018 [Aphidius gifuensis]|uniref:DH domain-containing protein n=1 Tax=Aphidius gifuensis TaxID=684658 RepID=A0A834XVP5_APHGI|nr:neuroepithelial cell-transforming gene 1 protein-like [Aphidius gifuensis]KAF7993432.1 hypothetical protein HCN44_010018 [Aphidius gifuensis]
MSEDHDENLDDTFQEPRKKFWQRSSRKRPKSDVISLSSMDISHDSSMIKNKKRKRITEFATNLLSSTSTLQRSFGLTANNSISIIEDDNAGPSKRTRSNCEAAGTLKIRSWLTDIYNNIDNKSQNNNDISKIEIKKQEAIYELFCGENILLNDLQIFKEYYYQPLQSTDIFTQSELRTVFGDIDMLIHIHCKLRDDLIEIRNSSGITDNIGSTLLDWLPILTQPYIDRCRSQIFARHILDEKNLRNKKFQEFIKKKMEQPRAVDLWTYIDMPRSRIVKYPILVNEILKRTNNDCEDYLILKDASIILTKLLDKINQSMGEAECDLAKIKINIKDNSYDTDECIKNATQLITEGQLKDSKGLKFYCFLFDTCLAMTRRVPRSKKKIYNLIENVIPNCQLNIDNNYDNSNCELKLNERLFILRDEHDKRHWIDAFNKINCQSSIIKKKKSINNNNELSPITRILRNKKMIKRVVRERPI